MSNVLPGHEISDVVFYWLVEIAVNDDFVDKTIEAIIEGARTGQIGDGKIFVMGMKECIRIRTGEKGKKAIG